MNTLDKEIIVSRFKDKVNDEYGWAIYLMHVTFCIVFLLVFINLFKFDALASVLIYIVWALILIGFETRITKRIFKKEWIKISKEIAKNNPYKVGVKILEPNDSCFKETKKEYTIKNINMDCMKVLLTDVTYLKEVSFWNLHEYEIA